MKRTGTSSRNLSVFAVLASVRQPARTYSGHCIVRLARSTTMRWSPADARKPMAAAVVVTAVLMAYLLPPSLATPLKLAERLKDKGDLEKTQNYWKKVAKDELRHSLRLQHNNRVAKNVIMFLGDGMSIPTLTASRIYKGQQQMANGEEGTLFFEKFPYVGLSKTYNVNKQVADSASTATAYLTGVKTNYKTLGVDGSVTYKDCHTMTEESKVYSIVKWAQNAGKRTGVVTSTRVTHATPAATYAHVADRDWECDGNIPVDCTPEVVKDIARQLVEDEPGSSINVMMGGGLQNLDANAVATEDDPFSDKYGCVRQDNMNLTDLWVKKKTAAGVKHAFVTKKSQLKSVNTGEIEYLLGIFANDHLQYEYEKKDKNLDVPTLAEMTKAAIEILSNEEKGYFLLVEGGRIDHAHHNTQSRKALDETVAMDEAVEVAWAVTDERDTLIVVTADHAHTMSISGYPKRGQSIIGLAQLDDNHVTYSTLMYANGPGYNYTVEGNHVSRLNLTQEMVLDWNYEHLAAVPKGSETHGGDDVAIYARGPMAHLFHGLHEQNYIAHVMAYSACIGDYTDECRGKGGRVTPTLILFPLVICIKLLS